MKDASPIDAEAIRAEVQATFSTVDQQSPASRITRIGYTFAELKELEFPERDQIINGLGRREVGMLNAVTNVGKTTFVRNLALSLITGRPFSPLTDSSARRRVAIIDSEDTLPFFRSDILKMIFGFSDEEKELVRNGLFVFCDTPIGDEDLIINNPDHFVMIAQQLQEFGPDIVVVDTISRCFRISNENDNSEIKERVMKYLIRLAKQTDAAVIALHHIGKAKSEEGTVREGSHRGRGASAFGDQSRLILNLEREAVDDCVRLSCPKVKGAKYGEQAFRLNQQTRWFEPISAPEKKSNYTKVVGVFPEGKPITTKEVVDQLKGEISERNIKTQLALAAECGDLIRLEKGKYQRRQPEIGLELEIKSAEVQNI